MKISEDETGEEKGLDDSKPISRFRRFVTAIGLGCTLGVVIGIAYSWVGSSDIVSGVLASVGGVISFFLLYWLLGERLDVIYLLPIVGCLAGIVYGLSSGEELWYCGAVGAVALPIIVWLERLMVDK